MSLQAILRCPDKSEEARIITRNVVQMDHNNGDIKMKIKMMIMSLVAVFVMSSASSVFAQGDSKMASKMDSGMDMSEMMNSSHHRMGMAYRKNINTLAGTLADLSTGSESVDAGLVRSIVADIKSASAMMDRIHMDHMSKMKPEMKTKMAPMMEKMKVKKEALKDHIAALEKAANADSIDMNEIGKHAAAIAEATKPAMMMKESHKDKMKMDDKMTDM